MEDRNIIKELSLLVSYSLEGEITDQQFSRLEEILKESKQARECYYRLLATYSSLSEKNNIVLLRNEKEQAADFEVLSELLAQENTSPPIKLEKPIEKEVVQEISGQDIEDKKRKLRFYHRLKVFISAAAVFIFAVLMIHTVLQPVEIATVTNSMNTSLSTGEELTDGLRLIKSDSVFRLKRGLLELTYDCDARLVIESPATFSVVSGKSIKLDSGRIYLKALSREAKGFTVITPNSDVVDLGTEFGVLVDQNGISEVHMTSGSASLRSKVHQKQQVVQTLTAGNAGRVDYTGKITGIDIRKTEFARSFNQKNGVVWRGQDLNLADVIAGGNGLGSGLRQSAIDPENGNIVKWGLNSDRMSNGKYIPVHGSRFIDGVFIPDGGDGPVTVSSRYHTWDAPDTTGEYKFNIVSSLRIIDDISDITVGNNGSDVMLAQSLQGNKAVHTAVPEAWNKSDNTQHSSIFMHSNLGITYDLDELRTVVSGQKLSSFRSTFGVMEQYMRLEGVEITGMHIDLWVLIDGEIKYSAKDINATKLLDIDVEIEESDSFLSLVVTQSIDGFAFDWGLFVDPVLKLKSLN